MVMQSTVNASYEGSIPPDAFQRLTARLVFYFLCFLGSCNLHFCSNSLYLVKECMMFVEYVEY
jgi:hypothetical protein